MTSAGVQDTDQECPVGSEEFASLKHIKVVRPLSHSHYRRLSLGGASLHHSIMLLLTRIEVERF